MNPRLLPDRAEFVAAPGIVPNSELGLLRSLRVPQGSAPPGNSRWRATCCAGSAQSPCNPRIARGGRRAAVQQDVPPLIPASPLLPRAAGPGARGLETPSSTLFGNNRMPAPDALQPLVHTASHRRGAIRRSMLLLVVGAAIGTSLALVWMAGQIRKSVPDSPASTVPAESRSTPAAAPPQAADSPGGTGPRAAEPVSAMPAEQPARPVRISAAERERIRRVTQMLQQAQLVNVEPDHSTGTNRGEIEHQPDRTGFFDEEQLADRRADEEQRQPSGTGTVETSRDDAAPPAPRNGSLRSPAAPRPRRTTGRFRTRGTRPGKPGTTAATATAGQQTLTLWNRLNDIIEREAEMRTAPAGGVTATNADGFLRRRAEASQFAADAIADLKPGNADRSVVRLAADLSQWYEAGVDVAETGRKLLKARPEVRRGPQGRAWRAEEEQHNRQAAELNRTGAEVRQAMEQRYGLAFPPLK